jgi:hypothetical protein
MDSQSGIITIHSAGQIKVDEAIGFLESIQQAYNKVYAFLSLIDSLDSAQRHLPNRDTQNTAIVEFFSSQIAHYIATSERFYEFARDVVPASDKLLLNSVVLESPGFWAFLGKLNPLEVVRKYLCDRHERLKDRNYRNAAEKSRLEYENELLKTKIVSDRIKIAKSVGITDAQLHPLLNRLLFTPLTELDSYQDGLLIQDVEFKAIPLKRDQRSTNLSAKSRREKDRHVTK